MRLLITGVCAVSYLLLSGCSAKEGATPVLSEAAIQSLHTGLAPGSCRKEADKTDPNETPYLLCPGVAGYSLIVRRVDSGRHSIDVVDPEQRVFPLRYQEVVTRHMFTLGEKAEWRVAAGAGKQVPIALIVEVRAREDNTNPETVTRSYAAVAKLGPNQACVTDSIVAATLSEAAVQRAADSARDRQCAQPQPVIR